MPPLLPVDVTAQLPPWFWAVPYVGSRYPGAVPRGELHLGGNCQLFAYEVLGHFGIQLPDLRSDELWLDASATTAVASPQPLDLALFSDSAESWGAHVGVVVGSDAVLHLCEEVGRPAVWDIAEFTKRDRYRTIIGYKRPLGSVSRVEGRHPG